LLNSRLLRHVATVAQKQLSEFNSIKTTKRIACKKKFCQLYAIHSLNYRRGLGLNTV